MSKIIISLRDANGTEHAKGYVDIDKIQDAHLVERNRRLYYFKPGTSKIGSYIFEECNQPYIVTEF